MASILPLPMRRKNSTFRRRTNTYAKNTNGPQRTLDLYWVVHNYIRTHYMTKTVPAVAVGLIEKRMTCLMCFIQGKMNHYVSIKSNCNSAEKSSLICDLEFKTVGVSLLFV